jgi:hypothetical protein
MTNIYIYIYIYIYQQQWHQDLDLRIHSISLLNWLLFPTKLRTCSVSYYSWCIFHYLFRNAFWFQSFHMTGQIKSICQFFFLFLRLRFLSASRIWYWGHFIIVSRRADNPHRNIPNGHETVREAKARLWAVAPLIMMMMIIVSHYFFKTICKCRGQCS